MRKLQIVGSTLSAFASARKGAFLIANKARPLPQPPPPPPPRPPSPSTSSCLLKQQHRERLQRDVPTQPAASILQGASLSEASSFLSSAGSRFLVEKPRAEGGRAASGGGRMLGELGVESSGGGRMLDTVSWAALSSCRYTGLQGLQGAERNADTREEEGDGGRRGGMGVGSRA